MRSVLAPLAVSFKNLLGSALPQCGDLRRNALPSCRYPRIAVFHANIVHIYYAQRKPNKTGPFISVQNS